MALSILQTHVLKGKCPFEFDAKSTINRGKMPKDKWFHFLSSNRPNLKNAMNWGSPMFPFICPCTKNLAQKIQKFRKSGTENSEIQKIWHRNFRNSKNQAQKIQIIRTSGTENSDNQKIRHRNLRKSEKEAQKHQKL